MDDWIIAGAIASFGTVAVAAVALALQIRADIRERRRRPLSSVSLEPDPATLDRDGRTTRIDCQLVNDGDEHVVFVELVARHCQVVQNGQKGSNAKVRHIDRSASMLVQLDMEHADVDRAWVAIKWTPPGTAGSFLTWIPANTAGPLAEDVVRRIEEAQAWPRWRWLAHRLRHRRALRLVGPERRTRRFVSVRELRRLSPLGPRWVEHLAPLETPAPVPLRQRLRLRRTGSPEVDED